MMIGTPEQQLSHINDPSLFTDYGAYADENHHTWENDDDFKPDSNGHWINTHIPNNNNNNNQ